MTHSTSAARTERIQQVIGDFIDRRVNGEAVSDQALLAAHPELQPELGEALRDLDFVQQAQLAADQSPSGGLRIRCPHCHHPIEIVDDSSLSDVICPSCGSQFSLTDDSDRTFQARQHELVNHFQLLDRVGVGAFGSVWSARDTQLDRLVALKIPRKGELSPEEAEQFIREARAAAQLKHPNIVSVLEVGRYKDRIYIACDFIQGLDLADWLSDHQATPREAAELCVTVADALEHAHRHGVIHRDLKPSNIMLDAQGEPHLMDFGLAKREAGEITMTVDGKLLGTPAYMSPEQARGAAHAADARSDVYSLGVILFEVLTGERPFRGNTRMLLHQVLVEDAPSPRKLNSDVPKDLETICLKCMEKDPERRYPSAFALRDDLQRFLRDEPVAARPITRLARAWRWSRRHPAAAISVALILFMSIAGPLLAMGFISLSFATSKAKVEALRARDHARRLLYTADMNLATQALDNSNVPRVVELLERHYPDSDVNAEPGFEWYYLWAACSESLNATRLDDEAISHVAYLEDGKTIVTVTNEGKVTWRDSETLVSKRVFDLADKDFDVIKALSPTGNELLIASQKNGFELVSLQTGLSTRTGLPMVRWNFAGTFSPDGKYLARGSINGQIAMWNCHSGQNEYPVFQTPDSWISDIVFSPDGQQFVTCSGAATIWQTATGEPTGLRLEPGPYCFQDTEIKSAAFSPDGKWLATGTDGEHCVLLWQLSDGQMVRKLGQFESAITKLAFSPDGTSLATASKYFPGISLWSATTGERMAHLACKQPRTLQFSPDGMTLAFTETNESGIRLWKPNRNTNPTVLEVSHDIECGVLSDDGRHLVTGDEDGEVSLWDIESAKKIRQWNDSKNVWHVAISRDRRFVASSSLLGNQIRLWDFQSDELLKTFEISEHLSSFDISPDGCLLAGQSLSGVVTFWDLQTDDIVSTHDLHHWGSRIAFSPDGSLLAAVGNMGTGEGSSVKLIDTVRHQLIRTLENDGADRQVFKCIRFSQDGRWLAVAGESATVYVWDVVTGEAFPQLSGQSGHVLAIAFLPNSHRIVSGEIGGQLRVWDFRTGELSFEMKAHNDRITLLATSNDGRQLITGSYDNTIRFWRAANHEEVMLLREKLSKKRNITANES